MARSFTRRISGISGAIALMASIAQAQDVPNSFDQLRVVIKSGDTVTVTGTSGSMTRGRILDLSSTRLGLQVDGQRREFSVDDVWTISQRRHASLATGAKWGIGVGTGLAVLWLFAGGAENCECGAAVVIPTLMIGGLGAAAGAGVAASTMSDHVIFAGPGSSLNLSMAPIVGRDRKGMMFTVRW